MAIIDLGKVRGEDGKDGKDGINGIPNSIELLEAPLLESEVYSVAAENDSQVKFAKWNIPLRFDKLTVPIDRGDVITIELESPHIGYSGQKSTYRMNFKCFEIGLLDAFNSPIPLRMCGFRLSNILEPTINVSRDNYGICGNIEYDDFVMLGGAGDIIYISNLIEFLDWFDNNTGGVVEDGVTTDDLRAEIGETQNNLLLSAPGVNGGWITPWWKYKSSESTDYEGNLSAILYGVYRNNSISLAPMRYSTSENGSSYYGQYIIKSVKYRRGV